MRKIIAIQEDDVARRFESPDGMVVLVGKSAADNDLLTFKIAAQNDFWMHVASESGSHVVVRNPENLDSLPRETLRFAASLAARFSKAKNAKRVTVHVSRRKDVQKEHGMPAGKVLLKRFKSVKVEPHREP